MSDDIWATVIVASVSIIGIVITQIWSFRSSKASFVIQTRAGLIQEVYRDNYMVFDSLVRLLSNRKDKESLEKVLMDKGSIEKVQKVIDEHPYNFSLSFLSSWSMDKDKLLEGDEKALDNLGQLLENSLEFYLNKYLAEVLGLKSKEIKDYRKVVLGPQLEDKEDKN